MKNLTNPTKLFFLVLLVALIMAPEIVMAGSGTGGTVTTAGGNTVHTYDYATGNGTFNWTGTDANITIMILAGGGGGGINTDGYSGGGGGGGGLIYNSSYSITAGTYNISIGMGGAGGTTTGNGSNGGNSAFNSLIAIGGGGGGQGNAGIGATGVNGGSGGGGGSHNATGGNATSGQGNTGGTAYKDTTDSGLQAGGGGGAGTTGGNGTATVGGYGGNGTNYSINGSNTYYAGGGGGATYQNTVGTAYAGMGGGGNGGKSSGSILGGNGTNKLGGGGGGGAGGGYSGRGGSGTVIISYITTGVPTITFSTLTTSAGKYYNETLNSITAGVNVTDFNATNITIFLHNGTGYSYYWNTTNFTAYFNDLTPGNYYINATSKNATNYTINSSTLTIIIWGTTINITSPTNNQNITETLNISYINTTTPTGSAFFSNHNITIMNSDGSLNHTVNSSTNLTTINHNLFLQNLTVGNYTLQIKTTDNYSNNKTYNRTFTLIKDGQVNLTVKYPLGNLTLGNYTLNVIDEGTGIIETYNTTENITNLYIIKGHNYTFAINKTGYALMNYTLLSFTQTYNNYTFNLYTSNSVLITIYDESTLTIINTSTVSITFSNNVTSLVYTTANGTYYKGGLNDGLWEVKFYSTNYSYRSYFITVNNLSFQTLDAYLVPSTYTCIFTIRDSLTLAPLESTSFSVERQSNSSYIVVESKISDIGGNVQIGFLPGIEYRFTLIKSGYTSKVFSLNPIIFNSYNVYLDKIASLNNTLDYGNVNIAFYPKTFYNNRANGITFTITSPEGVLTDYKISIQAPGGNNSTSGNNAIGETFTLNFNITNASIFDRVNITYNYTSTIGGIKIYRIQYEIIGAGNVGNYTIANLKNKDYGMGTFEKVLLVMIGTVIIAGFAFMLTGTAGALVMGLIGLNVSVYLGFLPYWSVIIPDILGIIIIIAVSTGGKN